VESAECCFDSLNQRKHYSATQKVEILREHLENQVPISDLARRYGVHPNLLHKWKKQLFEGAVESFGTKRQKHGQGQTVRASQLGKSSSKCTTGPGDMDRRIGIFLISVLENGYSRMILLHDLF
jgi:transposase-like protein